MLNLLYQKYVYISCEKATFLCCKKAESKLSRNEIIRLRFHLLCCTSCTRFAKQIVLLDKKMNDLLQNDDFKMSDEKKEALQKKLSEF
jgi:hypothetical protein